MKKKGLHLLLVVSCLLVNCMSFDSGKSGTAGTDIKIHGMEIRVIDFVNETRLKGARCGNTYYAATRPLVWNDKLGQAALVHSLDMAGKHFLGHTGSDGSNLAERVKRAGYKWSTVGENVGEGQQTPAEAVQEWLKSESHCRNMMNPEYKEAGAAYAKVSQKVYWTLVVATPGR